VDLESSAKEEKNKLIDQKMIMKHFLLSVSPCSGTRGGK
jgi:hypothetical protein